MGASIPHSLDCPTVLWVSGFPTVPWVSGFLGVWIPLIPHSLDCPTILWVSGFLVPSALMR